MDVKFGVCRVVKASVYRLSRDLRYKIKGNVCALEIRIINYVVK